MKAWRRGSTPRRLEMSATRMITTTEMTLDTTEVSTCPHSTVERAIGMEWNRSIFSESKHDGIKRLPE